MAVTFDDIERRARGRLSENDVEFFTQQNLLDWANEGQDVIAAAVPFTAQTAWQAVLPARSTGVQLSDECIQPTGAVMQGSSGIPVRLDYIEPDLMDARKSWRGTPVTGSTVVCTVRTRLFGRSLEWDRAFSEPMVLTVEGHMRPRPLVDADSETDIPAWLVHVVIDYMLWQAKKKDEETREADQAEKQFAADMEELAVRRFQAQADQFNRVRWGRSLHRPRSFYGGFYP